MFSSNQSPDGERKDTVVNAEQTGRFVWNLATYNLREAVNATAEHVPSGVGELELAGLEKEKARLTDIPMVEERPVKFECEYHSTIRVPGEPPMGTVDIIIGKVVAVHIKNEVLTDGKLDILITEPIARCGYYQYAVIRDIFEMKIPGGNALINAGLEASSKENRAANANQLQ